MNRWTCTYCGRENPGDRLTCGGCQAPYRRAEAPRYEALYKGRPLSTLTDAEMDEAADTFLDGKRYGYLWPAVDVDLPEALVDALRRKMEALYEGPEVTR